VFADRPDDRRRQDRHAILTTLSVAHDEFAMVEDEILHAKPTRFHQPQPAAIEQIRHQPARTVKLSQDRTHVGGAEHHGKPLWPRRSGDVLKPRQVNVEDLPVKKQ
jgi:hypothetical protein